MDKSSHIAHWVDSAEEDFVVARKLIDEAAYRHGCFFLHLTLEKYLKALVVQATGAQPPKIHNLVRLSEIARIECSKEELRFFAKANRFNLEGRYSVDPDLEVVNQAIAVAALKEAEACRSSLKSHLSLP